MTRVYLMMICFSMVFAIGCPGDGDSNNGQTGDAENDITDVVESEDSEDEEDTEGDGGEACNVYCDLTDPVQLFVRVEDAAGAEYCEDTYEVTARDLSSSGAGQTKQCECGQIAWPDGGAPDVGFGDDACHFDYFPGKQVEIEVDAPGYEAVSTEVSIKCECASEQTVTLQLPE